MCARKRLRLETLETRDLFAVAEFTTRLYADDGGAPGELLSSNEVQAGESFYVEILAREFHPRVTGLSGVSLDLAWNPGQLQILDESPIDTITDDLPAFRTGTLDAAAGTITDLGGSALLAYGSGRAIGNSQPERFALLHVLAIAPTDDATFTIDQGRSGITTAPVLSLKAKDLSFIGPHITIVGVDSGDEDSADSAVDPANVVDDNSWQLDIPVEENVVDDSGDDATDGNPNVIFYSMGVPKSDDPRVEVKNKVEHPIKTALGNVASQAVDKLRHLTLSPLARHAAAHADKVKAAVPRVKVQARPVTDWSKIQVIVVGDIPAGRHPVANILTARAAKRKAVTATITLDPLDSHPVQLQTTTVDAAPGTTPSTSNTMTTSPTASAASVSVPTQAEDNASPATKPTTTQQATTTAHSLLDRLQSHWHNFATKIKHFDWSPFAILLICLCTASSALAQEQRSYDPLEAFRSRPVRRPPGLSRPLPPIRRSIATATKEDILALGAEEEVAEEETYLSDRRRTDSRSPYRRAHFQEDAGNLDVELPAELESKDYIYDDSQRFAQAQGPAGMLGYRAGPAGQRPQSCGPLWVRPEYLGWWMEGYDVPALITTSPAGTSQNVAGVLGHNSTSILYGNQSIQDQYRSGARITLGWWLDPQDTIGLQGSYFILENSSRSFSASSPGTAIIARPFFNVEPGFEGQDAELVAYPGLFLGNANVSSSSSLQGAELLGRGLIARQGCWRVDGLFGYRYQRLKETLAISDSRTVVGTGTGLAVGTAFTEMDQFNTSNEFHGGELGVTGGYAGRVWALEGTMKLAIGVNRNSVLIAGNSTSSVPVNGVPQVTNTPAGLLAQSTNIGHYKTDSFAVIPEVGATLGYAFTPCLRGTVGYTFMYWTDVVRPGGQIDPTLNLSQLAVGGLNGAPSPQYRGVTDNIWIQGVSVGLDWQF